MSEEVKPMPSGDPFLTVRMPEEVIGQLKARARQDGCSVSELVRQMIAWELAGAWHVYRESRGNYVAYESPRARGARP